MLKTLAESVSDPSVNSDAVQTEDGEEITISMGVESELTQRGTIKNVSVFFSTYGSDDGLGDEDPTDYWSYEECFNAASEFLDSCLEEN